MMCCVPMRKPLFVVWLATHPLQPSPSAPSAIFQTQPSSIRGFLCVCDAQLHGTLPVSCLPSTFKAPHPHLASAPASLPVSSFPLSPFHSTARAHREARQGRLGGAVKCRSTSNTGSAPPLEPETGFGHASVRQRDLLACMLSASTALLNSLCTFPIHQSRCLLNMCVVPESDVFLHHEIVVIVWPPQ